MNTSWLDNTDVAEPDGMGSWLSSFLKCGSKSCRNPAQEAADVQTAAVNDQLEGQVATSALAVLAKTCKMPKVATAAKVSAKKYMTANNAYAGVVADPNTAAVIVNMVVADLMTGEMMDLPNCTLTPTGTVPTGSTPVSTAPVVSVAGINVSPTMLIAGAGLLVAVSMMGR